MKIYKIMYVPDSTFLINKLFYHIDSSGYYKLLSHFDEFAIPKEFELLFLAQSCLQNWCLDLGIYSNNIIIPQHHLNKSLFEIIEYNTDRDYRKIGALRVYQ